MEFVLGMAFIIALFFMIVIAIQKDQLLWGIGIFFLPFPVGFIYGALNWRETQTPMLVMIGSVALIGLTM